MPPPRLDEAAPVEAPVATVPEAPAGTPPSARPDPETTKAVGLAAATMAANLVAVVFTVIFTRLLGAGGYGSLAALLNLSVILFVPGAALQVAAAREGTVGRLGRGGELAGTLSRWSRHILIALGAVAVCSCLARQPLAAVLNVEQEWGAAAVPITAVLWLLLSLQRGLLQAARSYRAVGLSIAFEALGRLAVSLAFVWAGLGVTGAYLGTLASLGLTALALELLLRRRLGPPEPGARQHPLRALARDAALPIAALTVVAALQNVDVIMAKHALNEHAAGVYAAATVAAKAVVWIAVGLGFWVLPEATRRAAAGADPRGVLGRGLGLIAAISLVALAVFATVPALLLRTAFGAEYEAGEAVLLTLGAAYALLAAGYLGVQFLLGLRRRWFAAALAVVAVTEPALLAGAHDLSSFASTVLGVQAVGAVLVLALAAATRASPSTRPGTP
ncbi:MAG TPA: oligosaccharide flippase family protein [Solirubrobacteraceae bacterium]|nr:oligosaccharide flippase family protein [Solirubrobacteraceae bacterium]